MDGSTGSDDQISASRSSISNDEARTVELTSTGSTGAPGFLEEHRDTGKFSGKYAPQPQQTELIWTMPWGCWVELEDKDVHHRDPIACAALVFKTRILGLANFLGGKMISFSQIIFSSSPLLVDLNAPKQREWHGRGPNTFPKEDFSPNKTQV